MGLTPTEQIRLVRYCDHLQSMHPDELGFLPRVAIAEYSERRQIFPATQNGEWCGYILFFDGRNGKRPRLHPYTLKMHQICIQYDVRRVLHATRLVDRLVRRAEQSGMNCIEGWVASDLDANVFWDAVGFEKVDTRLGGRKRKRVHNLWRKCVPAIRFPRLSLEQRTHHPP